MKFYYEGLEDAGLSYDGTADSGYPETNLNNRNQHLSFKDTIGTGGNELTINLGGARIVDHIALVNYTAETSGIVVGLTLYSSEDGEAWDSVFSDEEIDSTTRTNFIKTFNFLSKQYWKIRWRDPSGLNPCNIDIPVILLGAEFEPASNPSMGVKTENVYSMVTSKSAGGHRFANLNHDTNERSVRYYWKYLSATDKTNWESLRDEVKPGADFAAYPMLVYDENEDYHYQRLAGPLTIREVAYNAYDLEITLLDEI